MHKKNKSPLDGVVSDYTLRILFILFTLFSFHFSLLAENISSKEDNATAKADKYNSIGMTYLKKGKYDKALEFFEKSLKIDIVATIGENNPDIATTLKKGKYDKVLVESLKKSLKIYIATTIGENSPYIMNTYNQILKMRLITLVENHSDIATSYIIIGFIWESKGEYNKAIKSYNKALNIRLVSLGEKHVFTVLTHTYLAHAFNGLAFSYRDKKEYLKAIDYYNRALLLHKKIAQINSDYSDEVLTDIENIIKTHQENNNPQKAKKTYNKALNYYNGLFKKDKKVYSLNYVRIIIKGVEEFDLDKDELEKAKTILATLPQNSITKGLLLQIEELEGSVSLYIWAFMILSLLGLIFYLKRYKNPLVVKLSQTPKELLNLNIEQLKEAEERLTKIDRFKNILSQNNITTERYKKAIAFEHLTQKEKANYIAKRLFAKPTELTKQSYMLKLSEDFPLNVKQFILFFSDKESISDMMSEIKQIPQYSKNPLFILASNSEQQAKLGEERKKGFEQFVVVEPKVITQMLLVADGSKVLADAFAQQLALTTISPYNLGGGERNSSMFFGRREIISHIVSRENNNYIVVGSRQIGKSSLLKALEREYKNSEELVYYIQVGQSSIVRAIGRAFGLKTKSLEELVEYLSGQKQKAVILLDEVDPFIKEEKKENYKILDAMRKLSEEGHCKFILAGYWELYRYSMLDNQSPLKNFGEIIELGALEYEACKEMIHRPMSQLGIGFKEEKSVNEIIEKTGQRPNLIAIICNTLIKNLGKTKRVIAHVEVEAVFKDKKLYELFESWKELDEDIRAGSIDRIIVYAMVEQEKFTLKELVERLKELGVSIGINEIEKSLSRLKISYIIERDDEGLYGFMLPLFREYVLKDDYEVKLVGEVEGL